MKKILLSLIISLSTTFAVAFEPTKPVTVIIAYGPGSGNEILFRKIESIISKTNKVNFVIDFKPGAFELIGMNHFASAPNDGYTLYAPGVGTYYGTPVWFKKQLKEDPVLWEPVISLGESPIALFASTDSTANSPEDVLHLLKSNKKVDFGVGAPVFVLAYENMITTSKSSAAQRIQYNSPAAVVQAVASKNVEFGLAPLSVAIELAKSGKIKVIGVTGKHNNQYPNLENTFKGLNLVAHVGLVLPPKTPTPIINYYKNIFTKAVGTQEYQDFLISINWYDSLKTPENYKAFFNNQRKQWIPVAETVEFK
jgi:tripartite-type tricarboxylate transporter receptor subunit TctC